MQLQKSFFLENLQELLLLAGRSIAELFRNHPFLTPKAKNEFGFAGTHNLFQSVTYPVHPIAGTDSLARFLHFLPRPSLALLPTPTPPHLRFFALKILSMLDFPHPSVISKISTPITFVN